MAFIYDLLDQWNAAGTTFTGIKLNVTDSASAAGSLLMDLQVGGVSQFRVSKAGTATLAGGVTFGDGSSIANTSIGLIQNRITVASTSTYAFSSTAGAFGTPDLILARDAANTLAQRNGPGQAQAFNLYNTYDNSLNYERGFMRWSSNILQIGCDKLGTGSNRTVEITANANTAFTIGAAESGSSAFIVAAQNISMLANRHIRFSNGTDFLRGIAATDVTGVRVSDGSTGGGTLELREMTAPAAPAANGVRIYAEDDGAGKTRLMARFATGAAVQIAIEP